VQVAVVVPVKAFRAAKARLAPALSPPERAALARRMATGVVRAAAPLPVTVVCDDPEVRAWAEDLGTDVCWSPGLGLDGAVSAGVAQVAAAGAARAVVAHADLPYARTFEPLAGGSGVLLVPDRHEDGTNVIALPTGCGFGFAYGPGSYRRHRAEAERLGLAVTVRADDDLGWDVDRPEDLDHPTTPLRGGRTGR